MCSLQGHQRLLKLYCAFTALPSVLLFQQCAHMYLLHVLLSVYLVNGLVRAMISLQGFEKLTVFAGTLHSSTGILLCTPRYEQ